METRANYALIGAFTLAVIVAAFGFVIWFSGGSKKAEAKVYRLVFTSSVAGLSSGSFVTFNGVRVGEVTGIELGDDPSQVIARIEAVGPRINAFITVRADTRARLEYQGLTGVASVALTGGGVDTPALLGPRDDPPTLAADRSDYQNILETLQGLSGKVDGVLAKADGILGAVDPKKVSATVDGISSFATTLERNSAATDQIVKNTQSLTAKLDTAADKLDGVLTSAQGFLGGPGGKGPFDQVGDAAAAIRKLAENLDKRTKDIADNINKFSGSGLRDYQALAQNGQRTLDELNRTVRSLQKNPQQVIFGSKPDLPEYSGK